MHRLKMILETIPDNIEVACELPALTSGVIPCEFNAEVEYQSTNGKHLVSTCSAHVDSGFSYAYRNVLQRLTAAANVQPIAAKPAPRRQSEKGEITRNIKEAEVLDKVS